MKVKKLVPFMLSAFILCGGVLAGCNNTINNTVNGDQNIDADVDANLNGGNHGNNQGSTGNDNQGSTGNENQGSTGGNQSGNQGSTDDNQGSTGDDNQGDNQGSTGDDNQGSTGDDDQGGNQGSTGNENQGGDDQQTPATDTSTPLAAGKSIYVVGDSTVCSFSDNYYLPRYGYGTQLAEYLNVQTSQIKNLALSGRSSKSFLTETNYTTLTSGIKEGDYLIIGFGHNDEKSAEPARFTDPHGTTTQETTAKGTSFKYCLYEYYVKMAQDKGAFPILCTPIVRYDASGAYSGAKVHNTDDGDYAAAIKELGQEKNVPVVDLTELTKTVYKADNDAAQYYHAHTTYEETPVETVTGNETPSGRDDTHINKYGAKMVAYQFAQALKDTDSDLKAQVITNKTAPTKADDYADAVNKSYKKPNYKPFDPTNTTATKLGDDGWYKTVLGDVGGASKLSDYTISYANDKFTVSNTANNGKFSGTVDGFGAAFIQIDATKNFTASATVKVTAKGTNANNQSAFGMMLRDDILVDTYDTTLASNFVAAGAFAASNGAIFSRSSKTALTTNTSNTVTVAAGSTYTVSIERIGQTVNVAFSDGTHNYTKTYTDFDFVAVDNDYMYLCLFANRGLSVEFSDVQFEITGNAQGA